MKNLKIPTIYVVNFGNLLTPGRAECREMVTKILEEYLGDHQKIELGFNHCGKPHVIRNKNLTFSYSHSSKQLAVVINPISESIGVDTEPLSRNSELKSIKIAAFSKDELANLASKNYLRAWSLKEAAVKRYGIGFNDADPHEFTVKTHRNTYSLYLGPINLQEGYFKRLTINRSIVMLCTKKPLSPLVINRHLVNA